ncbi:hypothetical protein ACKGJO_06095 [Gracilimonas sp. Q87]|uniref:hypothetical protein n=1 Tax=Gracilimonas sp. Q87 TaxID=3384766 RepID=UPI003983EF2C
MIKEVFNSIAASSSSGKSTSLEQENGGKEKKYETGFFGKMLMALQNEAERNTQSGETESGNTEKENGQQTSLLMSESKSGEETAKLISNEKNRKSEIKIEDQKVVKGLEETDIESTEQEEKQEEILVSEPSDESDMEDRKTSVDGEKIKNEMPPEEGSGLSLTPKSKAFDSDNKYISKSDISLEEKTERSEAVNENVEFVDGNDASITKGIEHSHDQLPTNEGEKVEINDNKRVNGSSDNFLPTEESSEQSPNGVLKESSIHDHFDRRFENESEKTLHTKPDQVVNNQISSAFSTETPNVKAEGELVASINNIDKETQHELQTEARRKFFELDSSVITKQVGLENTISDNNTKIRSPHNFTARRDSQIEIVNGDHSIKDDLKEKPQLQVELVNSQKNNEERTKRYDLFNLNSGGKRISEDRLTPLNSGTGTGSNQNGKSFITQPNWIQFQANNQQETEIKDFQGGFINEHILESTEGIENETSEQVKLNMNKLADMPINNITLKRSVLPGLTGALQRATSSGKEIPKSWQKHSFVLDDGNKIELSTRNIDGVIQVKIASSSIELNKLMQEYGQEIKDHLEQECELEIDLHFNEGGNETASEFSDNSPSSGNREGINTSLVNGSNKILNKKAEEHLQQAVRKFGYNQMEWTI